MKLNISRKTAQQAWRELIGGRRGSCGQSKLQRVVPSPPASAFTPEGPRRLPAVLSFPHHNSSQLGKVIRRRKHKDDHVKGEDEDVSLVRRAATLL